MKKRLKQSIRNYDHFVEYSMNSSVPRVVQIPLPKAGDGESNRTGDSITIHRIEVNWLVECDEVVPRTVEDISTYSCRFGIVRDERPAGIAATYPLISDIFIDHDYDNNGTHYWDSDLNRSNRRRFKVFADHYCTFPKVNKQYNISGNIDVSAITSHEIPGNGPPPTGNPSGWYTHVGPVAGPTQFQAIDSLATTYNWWSVGIDPITGTPGWVATSDQVFRDTTYANSAVITAGTSYQGTGNTTPQIDGKTRNMLIECLELDEPSVFANNGNNIEDITSGALYIFINDNATSFPISVADWSLNINMRIYFSE